MKFKVKELVVSVVPAPISSDCDNYTEVTCLCISSFTSIKCNCITFGQQLAAAAAKPGAQAITAVTCGCVTVFTNPLCFCVTVAAEQAPVAKGVTDIGCYCITVSAEKAKAVGGTTDISCCCITLPVTVGGKEIPEAGFEVAKAKSGDITDIGCYCITMNEERLGAVDASTNIGCCCVTLPVTLEESYEFTEIGCCCVTVPLTGVAESVHMTDLDALKAQLKAQLGALEAVSGK